jgi:hypothetical protein
MGLNWSVVAILYLLFISPLIFLGILFLIRWMGKEHFLFTLVEERTGQVIERYGKFRKAVMSVSGWKFRGNRERILEAGGQLADFESKLYPGDPDPWDIVPDPVSDHIRRFPSSLMGGIHLLGIPFIDQVKGYKQIWTSREEKPELSGEIAYVYKTVEKTLFAVLLLQEDVYYIQISNAEDKNGLNLKIRLAITATALNLVKATYGVTHWLEALENQLGAEVVKWTREYAYKEINTVTGKATAEDFLSHSWIARRILVEYGVDIRLIQIDNVDPPENYRDLTLAVYMADQKAQAIVREGEGKRDARILEAEGEARYLEQTIGYVADDPNRLEAWKWKNVAELRGTYVEGSATRPVISVPAKSEGDKTE